MDRPEVKAMLVNVGGTTAPAIHALNHQKPPFICFFVSQDSQPAIRSTILPALQYQPEHWDWIKTPAPQNLLDCYRALATGLPPILEKWNVTFEELGVEYTAGTKPMSVAAVLATIDRSYRYFYTGAADPTGRDKGGIGIVIDNKEYLYFQVNPWEELAISTRREIALLFNHGRFADARERALQLAHHFPEELGKVYEALANLIEGYALWDRFEYKQAQAKIYKALEQLRLFIAGRDDPLHDTLKSVEQNAEFLRLLNEKDDRAGKLDALDLLANATRRATNAQRYDDAVARLYALLESLARRQLLQKHNIKANNVRPEQIPENLREDYVRRLTDRKNPKSGLRLGLQDSYYLLAEINDELGQNYLERENEINEILNARNQSRLAHGTEPVRPDVYEKLRKIIMSFADIKEDDLPKFPIMKL
ncbi:MAG: TIGR02710 family CRISPR-associated CARF protein [Anaerolineales bacterium]|jgi:CRISPR-associated protein (TIGR02710 family)|nr:TIGR02710 family CRISPR-associated CARF protein [Anaerolineales bacterium]